MKLRVSANGAKYLGVRQSVQEVKFVVVVVLKVGAQIVE